MYKINNSFVFSPSDLTVYMDSPYASWMNRYSYEYPDRAPAKDEADSLLSVLADKGNEHEDRLVKQLEKRGSLIQIEAPDNALKAVATIAAMKEGYDVICQARLELGSFAGYADFLIKVPGQSILGDYYYEVWDAKLARSVKPYFIVQLCCYAEMLEAIQGMRPQQLTIALGSGEFQSFKTNEFFYYYKALKNSFLSMHDSFSPEHMPDPGAYSSWGDWSTYAESLLLDRDHLFQVAHITNSQIKRLNAAGIYTMSDLADSNTDRVSGIQCAVFERLKAQAEIQKQSAGLNIPRYVILPIEEQLEQKRGLALLPPESKLDVYFDIEGFPLDDGGLEYLWGNTYVDEQGNRCFKDFWAHNKKQEKQAFSDFIRWVYDRWLQDRHMHIYHYANYEIAACQKLMNRYGICEFELDQLLRHNVFVDLYKVVKGGILVGEPRYSIKNIEHLYRPKRETEVGNGGDSVVVYEKWRDQHVRGCEGDSWQTSAILKSIRDYNIDDCDSTLELADWLRERQTEAGISYESSSIEEEGTEIAVAEESETAVFRERILADIDGTDNSVESDIKRNCAYMLEFHKREQKPVWWKYFERLGMEAGELYDDLDCLANCTRTSKPAFKKTERARNLMYEFSFDTHQDFRGRVQTFAVLGTDKGNGFPLTITISPEYSDVEHGILTFSSASALPDTMQLIPFDFVRPEPIPTAVKAAVDDLVSKSHDSAIHDFMARHVPRIKGHHGGALVTADSADERLEETIHAVRNLDNSYLVIQGPPGCGKSYTGKHIIAALLQDGASIGISSNSHKAINNLLINSARYCAEQKIAADFYCTKNTDPELEGLGIQTIKNNEIATILKAGSLIGTTAWGFSREEMAGKLDYLFIDEAGQVSVANLLGMSKAAGNIVIMGDQMQLGQPTQTVHPYESGSSILDYLLYESPAISPEQGIFLNTSFRMHSRINRFISDAFYDSQLLSSPQTDTRSIAVPAEYKGPLSKDAGIIYIPVEHEGNSQASDEEVEAICAHVHNLLGRTFYTGNSELPERPITIEDMLFVAPYNHQVSKLKEALPSGAKVGSVDKFQGREAPIVFVSMCTSNPAESPRGLDFVLDKHRLNVAISRAQSLTIVVANPCLGIASVSSLKQMHLLNLFNRLLEYADN